MDAGMVGGIAGGVVGCAGAAIGTYFSIVNTTRPRGRALMIRLSAAGWLWLAAVVAFALLAPARPDGDACHDGDPLVQPPARRGSGPG